MRGSCSAVVEFDMSPGRLTGFGESITWFPWSPDLALMNLITWVCLTIRQTAEDLMGRMGETVTPVHMNVVY